LEHTHINQLFSSFTGPYNLRRPTDWDTENLVAMIKQWRQDNNARRIQPVDDEENHENASEPSTGGSPAKRPRRE
jgi:hypothetical protein